VPIASIALFKAAFAARCAHETLLIEAGTLELPQARNQLIRPRSAASSFYPGDRRAGHPPTQTKNTFIRVRGAQGRLVWRGALFYFNARRSTRLWQNLPCWSGI